MSSHKYNMIEGEYLGEQFWKGVRQVELRLACPCICSDIPEHSPTVSVSASGK